MPKVSGTPLNELPELERLDCDSGQSAFKLGPVSGEWILAVDGGGSKTALALIDASGQVVRRVHGAGSGPFDQPRWREVLTDLLGEIGVDLDAPPVQLAACGLALSGYGEAQATTQAQLAFAARLPRAVVCNDVEAAAQGAFLGRAGVLILAGTGSMVWALDGVGRSARAGGWGHGFGDEGSAYWVGHAALNSLSRAIDGRQPWTPLHRALSAALNLRPSCLQQDLLGWFAALPHPRSGVAALARDIDRLADAGDHDATDLMRRAADELALAAATAWKQLGPTPLMGWSLGGSLTGSRTVQGRLRDTLGAAAFTSPALPPLGGAAWLAARHAGWNADRQWCQTLAHSLRTTPSSAFQEAP